MPEPKPSTPPEWFHFDSLTLTYPGWLIDDILPTQSMICVYGKRGQGKTFLALDWACSIATGTPWLGKKVSAPGRVAYVLAERPEGIKRRMLGWLKKQGLTEQDGARLFGGADGLFFVKQESCALDNEFKRRNLIASLRNLMPLSLVVFDPLVSFMQGSENETRDMQEFVNGIREIVKALNESKPEAAVRGIADALNCSVLLVHHEGKGGERNTSRGARGSSALEAGMDTVIHLKGVNESDVAQLTITKQREFKAHKPISIRFVEQTDGARDLGQFPELLEASPATVISGVPRQRKRPLNRGEKKSAFAEHVIGLLAGGKALTLAQIQETLPPDIAKAEQRTRAELNELVEKNLLQKTEGKLSNDRPGKIYSLRRDDPSVEIQPPIEPEPSQEDAA